MYRWYVSGKSLESFTKNTKVGGLIAACKRSSSSGGTIVVSNIQGSVAGQAFDVFFFNQIARINLFMLRKFFKIAVYMILLTIPNFSNI